MITILNERPLDTEPTPTELEKKLNKAIVEMTAMIMAMGEEGEEPPMPPTP